MSSRPPAGAGGVGPVAAASTRVRDCAARRGRRAARRPDLVAGDDGRTSPSGPASAARRSTTAFGTRERAGPRLRHPARRANFLETVERGRRRERRRSRPRRCGRRSRSSSPPPRRNPLVRAISASEEGDELLVLVTTGGGPVLGPVTAGLAELIGQTWPGVDADSGGARRRNAGPARDQPRRAAHGDARRDGRARRPDPRPLHRPPSSAGGPRRRPADDPAASEIHTACGYPAGCPGSSSAYAPRPWVAA